MQWDIFQKKTKELEKQLDGSFIKKIHMYDTIDSTNKTAKTLAQQGEPEGTVVLAQTQSKGRGRFQRSWESPEGGLYLSLILQPSAPLKKISLLPFVGALAVSSSIQTLGLPSTIKWPNDVRINRQKVAGILLETDIRKDRLNYVILGIGVNLSVDKQILEHTIDVPVTSLIYELGKEIEYHTFLKTLLLQINKFYSLFTHHQYEQIIDEWTRQSDTLDKRIKIITTQGEITGIATSVDASGFLRVITDDKMEKTVISGDCHYLEENTASVLLKYRKLYILGRYV